MEPPFDTQNVGPGSTDWNTDTGGHGGQQNDGGVVPGAVDGVQDNRGQQKGGGQQQGIRHNGQCYPNRCYNDRCGWKDRYYDS